MNIPNWIYLLKKIANTILPNYYYSALRSIALDIWFGISNEPALQSIVYIDSIKNKSGLEIGGPSFLFKSLIPLYKYIKNQNEVKENNLQIYTSLLKRTIQTASVFEGLYEIINLKNLNEIDNLKVNKITNKL